jgi:DivIVA domain-containing protein
VQVDGDPTNTSEQQETTEQPAATEQQAAAQDAQAEHLSAEQLCDYVERASFAKTLGRRGYQQSEVDALLVRVTEALRAGEPLADLVRHTHLSHVRLEDGYDHTQVDDFLAAVVDLDPNADTPRPETGRSGLVGKLFG